MCVLPATHGGNMSVIWAGNGATGVAALREPSERGARRAHAARNSTGDRQGKKGRGGREGHTRGVNRNCQGFKGAGNKEQGREGDTRGVNRKCQGLKGAGNKEQGREGHTRGSMRMCNTRFCGVRKSKLYVGCVSCRKRGTFHTTTQLLVLLWISVTTPIFVGVTFVRRRVYSR
jgi:hypothetical protein